MAPVRRGLAAAVVALIAVLLVGCGGGAPVDAKALSTFSGSLESQAAEGALLAQDAAAGRTTSAYLHEQALDLFGLTSQVVGSLKGFEVVAAGQPALSRLRTLADRIAADLKQLGSDPADPSGLARDLQAAADEGKQIDQGLT